jgi:4-carboxymuconolactone decarboxylase
MNLSKSLKPMTCTSHPFREDGKTYGTPTWIWSVAGKEGVTMSKEPSGAQKMFGDFAPKLVRLTDNVLFGDVWEGNELSKRDRSLVTVAALVALNRAEQLRFHLPNAVNNGVKEQELIEAITHLAFYAGWPSAMSAMSVAKELFGGSK